MSLCGIFLGVQQHRHQRTAKLLLPSVCRVQLQWHHFDAVPVVCLKRHSSLHGTPIRLNVIGAHAHNWVGKVLAVIYYLA